VAGAAFGGSDCPAICPGAAEGVGRLPCGAPAATAGAAVTGSACAAGVDTEVGKETVVEGAVFGGSDCSAAGRGTGKLPCGASAATAGAAVTGSACMIGVEEGMETVVAVAGFCDSS